MTGLPERAWQAQIVELAGYYGWLAYHTFDSRRSEPGWPDLVLVRPPELLAVELKTDSGRLTVAQRRWLEALAACGIETHTWRPREFETVHGRLRRTVAA